MQDPQRAIEMAPAEPMGLDERSDTFVMENRLHRASLQSHRSQFEAEQMNHFHGYSETDRGLIFEAQIHVQERIEDYRVHG